MSKLLNAIYYRLFGLYKKFIYKFLVKKQLIF
ncbi:Uncharacterised protein [Streptococcus pneumoniae]|nr:Uncharacterised protein [Streptococcus pneumoniae]CAG5594903.1 Uncharacterised protein [Streptococcus pneumoniae]